VSVFAEGKVGAHHLVRSAFLYVRQSTVKQVVEHTESTHRQYGLRQKAVALGWADDQIVVIDQDLGQSAATSGEREGFSRMVAEVGLGHAGVVMGLEVSRLARNSSDWHRLVEICALAGTLILDEDGLYDPSNFNDRLVLGMKGTMSEAELYQIRARLRGGMLSKARRGELRLRLPVGFVEDASGRVVLDPDSQVERSVRLLFAEFRRTGSAHGAARAFAADGLLFPTRLHAGLAKGQIVWKALTATRATHVLHNPRYAGAYAYGQRCTRRSAAGALVQHTVPREEWTVLIPDAHAGYITFAEYEENLRRIAGNAIGERSHPPREGPALLQGQVLCGRCGARMTVRYTTNRGETRPVYVCQGPLGTPRRSSCQSVIGAAIDEAIGELLLEVVSPVALTVSLAVHAELQSRIEEADRLRHQRVERVEHEADLARRRFLQVDPDHRLVADSLEAEWNARLREVRECREEYDRRRDEDRRIVDAEAEAKIRSIVADLPEIWRNPATSVRDRKRIVRLLIEDVTVVKGEEVSVAVRFRGGATRRLVVPRSRLPWEDRRVAPEVVRLIDRKLGHHTHAEIAEILNGKGLVSGTGRPFDARRVGKIHRAYRLKSRYTRLREQGLLTLTELAARLAVCPATVKIRRAQGRLGVRAVQLDDVGRYLYEDPGDDSPLPLPVTLSTGGAV